MNVYEYVVVYRCSVSADTLRFLDKSKGVQLTIAASMDHVKKRVIHNLKLPDDINIEDVDVLVRSFIAPTSLQSLRNPWTP
jgi:hypothetical protein